MQGELEPPLLEPPPGKTKVVDVKATTAKEKPSG
jgi:hypothetical protein